MSERFSSLIAILLLITTSLACSMLRTKRPLTWRLTLEVDAPASDRAAAVKQSIQVIENRLSALGFANSEVQSLGDPASGRILVRLPDVADRERLRRVITAWGKLELTHVISPPSPAPPQTFTTKDEAVASLNSGGTIPSNRRVLPYVERASSEQGQKSIKWVVIESPAIINGSDLRNASAIPGRGGDDDYEITFSLGKEGAYKFGAWTGANTNEYIGVVLNDEVKSVAFIKSQISDQGVINGRFTRQSAEDLALVLKSGSLPAPLKIVEERNDK